MSNGHIVYALTIRQPWLDAILYYGKRIENRTRRPPEHLIGQVIGLHEAQELDENGRAAVSRIMGRRMPAYGRQAGFLLATACLTGVVVGSDDPWYSGPVGWGLAEVRPLAVPRFYRGNVGFWRIEGEEGIAVEYL